MRNTYVYAKLTFKFWWQIITKRRRVGLNTKKIIFLTANPPRGTHDAQRQINSVLNRGVYLLTDLKEAAIREEMRVTSRYVCRNVMDNFVLRLKKCTEPNGGHLEKML